MTEPLKDDLIESKNDTIPEVEPSKEEKQTIEFPHLGVIVISILLGLIVILSIIMQFL